MGAHLRQERRTRHRQLRRPGAEGAPPGGRRRTLRWGQCPEPDTGPAAMMPPCPPPRPNRSSPGPSTCARPTAPPEPGGGGGPAARCTGRTSTALRAATSAGTTGRCSPATSSCPRVLRRRPLRPRRRVVGRPRHRRDRRARRRPCRGAGGSPARASRHRAAASSTATARPAITDDERGTRALATLDRARRPRAARSTSSSTLPPGHESLNVVIPWSDERSTSPRSTRRARRPGARASATRAGRSAARRRDAWGVLDVGRGRWPYRDHAGTGAAAPAAMRRPRRRPPVRRQVDRGHRLHRERRHRRRPAHEDRPRARLGLRLGRADAAVARRRSGRAARRRARTPLRQAHEGRAAASSAARRTRCSARGRAGCVTDDGAARPFDGLQGFAEEARQRW